MPQRALLESTNQLLPMPLEDFRSPSMMNVSSSINKRAKIDLTDVDSLDGFDPMMETSPRRNIPPDMVWLPVYFCGSWVSFHTGKKMVTIQFQLLSGTTGAGKVTASVTDDGMQLVLKSQVPNMMLDLTLLHSDESSADKIDTDFHRRLGALTEYVDSVKKVWWPSGADCFAIARIPLAFPCENDFQMFNKGDKNGARIVYLTLKEKGSDEKKPDSDWPILDSPEFGCK